MQKASMADAATDWETVAMGNIELGIDREDTESYLPESRRVLIERQLSVLREKKQLLEKQIEFPEEDWTGSEKQLKLASEQQEELKAALEEIESLRAEILRVKQIYPEFVKAALKKNGYALRRASAAVGRDKDCVQVAVTWYGAALEFASEELQGDRVLVAAALQAPPLQDPTDPAADLPRVYTQDPTAPEFALQKDRPPLDDSFSPPRVMKDVTCWSHLPGSSKKKGGRMDPSDVFNVNASLEDVLYDVTLVRKDGDHPPLHKASSRKAKMKNAKDLKSGLKVMLAKDPMFRGKIRQGVEVRQEFWSPREEADDAATKFKAYMKGGTQTDLELRGAHSTFTSTFLAVHPMQSTYCLFWKACQCLTLLTTALMCR